MREFRLRRNIPNPQVVRDGQSRRSIKVNVAKARFTTTEAGSGFAAKFTGEQRDAHSLEITGGDKAIFGDDFRLRFSAPFEEP